MWNNVYFLIQDITTVHSIYVLYHFPLMASLCKLDYPIYACEALDADHVVVGGGGGSSKTGVPNVVDIVKIEKCGRKLQANPCERLELGNNSAMNIAVLNQGNKKPFLLAIGLGGTSKIYSVKKKSKVNVPNTSRNVTNRKAKKQLGKAIDDETMEHFEFNLLKTLETDFSAEDPLQKAVRISRDGKIIVTGGQDGCVRAWNIADFSKRFFSKGHKDDITDVDVSPDGKYIVSVSRDGTAIIWNSETGMKEADLHSKWNSQITTRNYRFRSCRYGTVVENPKLYALFTAHSPIRPGRGSDSKSAQGCLTKWARKRNKGQGSDTGPLCPAILQYTGREAISSMCISSNGVYLGVGFMEGSVSIYISYSLQCAKRVNNVHSIFVTGLSFLSPSEKSVAGACDAALVSVSADNQCKLLKLSSRTMFPIWFALLVIFMSLAVAAYLLREMGVI